MLQRLRNALLDRRGSELIINATVILIIVLMLIALAMKVFPVFTAKQQLDTYAGKLCRSAEIAGRVGPETDAMTRRLTETTGLAPAIHWEKTGNIQLGENVRVTLTITRDIGFFTFGSFPIPIEARAKAHRL